jgi:hypothetical protein
MQNVSPRTTHAPSEQTEDTNVKPVAEIEGAIRDLVGRGVLARDHSSTQGPRIA